MTLWGLRYVPLARAASPDIIGTFKLNTSLITHTASTTHQMSVYDDGRISGQFLTGPNENQIGTAAISLTSIAVMFDQHAATGNAVDVGSQGEFRNTTPITLDPTATVPGFTEESFTVYESKVLPYQITQRTRSFNTRNCVAMELSVENTGNSPLTNGKLMFLADTDAALAPGDDLGKFSSQNNLVYLIDYNEGSQTGHAIGISLLQGQFRGHGILQQDQANLPDPNQGDLDIQAELNTPLNLPDVNGSLYGDTVNVINWLVADIPTLDAGQSTLLIFGICATREMGGPEVLNDAEANLIINVGQLETEYEALAAISASEVAIKPDKSTILAGETLTYTVLLTNSGYIDLYNVEISNILPAFVDLISIDVSKGSATSANGTVAASIDALPVNEGASVDIVVRPVITIPNETVISNQTVITGGANPVQTNVVTHSVTNFTDLSISKQRQPPIGQLSPGEAVTYTLTYTNYGPGLAFSPTITDLIPTEVTDVAFTSTGPSIQTVGGSNYVWRVDDLWPGVSGSIEVTGIIASQVQDEANVLNTATIATKSDAFLVDTDTVDNASSAEVQIRVPQLGFSTASYTLLEGETTSLIRVELNTPAKAKITIDYATSDGTATAGLDYEATNGTLVFNPGDDAATFPIVIYDDAEDESNETILLSLSSPFNANLALASATLTLIDNFGVVHTYLPIVLRSVEVIPPPPPCSLHFADTFASPTSGWPVIEDTQLKTEYINNEYRLWAKDPLPLQYAYRTDDEFQDHEVEVSARWIDGLTGEGHGLIFALSGEGNTLNAYVFLINTDRRTYNLVRYINNSPTSLTQGWVSSDAIEADSLAINRLKVAHIAGEIQLFANDTLLFTTADNTINSGRVGLAVLAYFNDATFGTQQADVRFDDFALSPCDSANRQVRHGTSLSSEGMGRAARPE